MKDQRRWQRLPLGIPIVVKCLTEQRTPVTEFGTTINISAGGVLLAMRMPLLVGRGISLQIPAGFPEQRPRVKTQRRFRARVLRVVRQDHWYLYAAAFSSRLHTRTPPPRRWVRGRRLHRVLLPNATLCQLKDYSEPFPLNERRPTSSPSSLLRTEMSPRRTRLIKSIRGG